MSAVQLPTAENGVMLKGSIIESHAHRSGPTVEATTEPGENRLDRAFSESELLALIAAKLRKEKSAVKADGKLEILEQPLVREVMGESLCVSLHNVFHQIEIAEEMMAEWATAHPAHAPELTRRLKIFQWHAPNTPQDVVYRNHVAEILDRIVVRSDLAPGTRAEVLMFSATAASRELCNNRDQALFVRIFWDVSGRPYCKVMGLPDPYPWDDILRQRFASLSTDLIQIERRVEYSET